MAVAFSPKSARAARTQTIRHAASWTGISAAVAVAMMLPIFLVLLNLVSQIMFVRNGPHDGDWLRAAAVTGLVIAPATYLLFVALTSDLLTKYSDASVRRTTLKIAALSALPWAALMTIGYMVDSLAIKTIGTLSLFIAMAYTVWATRRAK